MAFHPVRARLSELGQAARRQDSPFRAEAEATLDRFRSIRHDLERQVQRGEITVRVARERAAATTAQLRQALLSQSSDFSPAPRVFLDRLTEVTEKRRTAGENASLEALQRETNQLLRQTLVEQQITTRSEEFRYRTFLRPLDGGEPAPTVASLLAFHEQSSDQGDEAAREWSRRQLEAVRPSVPNPDDQKRIDKACDRPGQVNPSTVSRYVEAMEGSDHANLETFISHALDSRDANACCAAFILARNEPAGLETHWTRLVLDRLDSFPEAALSALRTWETEIRRTETQAAQAQAEYVLAFVDIEAKLAGVHPPDDREIDRRARTAARPLTGSCQPVGLSLNYRGLTQEEYAALQAQPPQDGATNN